MDSFTRNVSFHKTHKKKMQTHKKMLDSTSTREKTVGVGNSVETPALFGTVIGGPRSL